MHATLFLSLVALAAAADWPLGPNARIGRTRTPLDDYVNKPDDHFSYYLYNTSKGVGFTAYTINMTSQKWLTENDVDRPVWWHWVVIMVPDELVHTEKSFVYITGNGNGGAPDLKSEDNLLASELAVTTKSVATALFEIPNEPLHFVQEPGQPRRSEDGIIAYTWKHFIDDPSQPEWLLRLPMTKAVVRAMDTVQQFVEETHGFRIRNFTVAGASKRGWTTWTTGAVDARVEAIAPMVMDELNFVKNLHHHYRAYGGWTFAFEDYYSLNFTAEIDNPNVELMDAIVNPSAYVDRLTMPKYIICSGGDEFFLPDDSHYYWDTLLGEKFIRIIPNAEHSLATRVVSVFTGLQGFYYTVLTGAKRPSIQWKYDDVNGVISVTTDVKPKAIHKWHAHTLSETRRDFRLIIGGPEGPAVQPVLWVPGSVESPDSNTYVGERSAHDLLTTLATMPMPKSGWTAFLIELQFANPGGADMIFSTEVNIIPNTFPFPDCHGEACRGKLV